MTDTHEATSETRFDPEFEALLEFIKENRGFDFTGYKRTTLFRRVSKRMQTVGIAGFTEYQGFLEERADEFVALFNTILINVTSFMRDDFAWQYMREELIPRILESKQLTQPIRLWSAGCASGEEAYSLAMLFAEACGEQRFRDCVKIYATDVDAEALATARHATYPTEDVRKSVPEDLVDKYFDVTEGTAKFRKDLRRSVIFGRNDLVQDPPISRIDLLTCRNTLMYFNVKAQNRMLANFHFGLNPGGYLFLGKSEVSVTRSHQFDPVDLKRRIFAKGPTEPHFSKREPVMSEPEPSVDASRQPIAAANLVSLGFESTPHAELVLFADSTIAAISHRARTFFSLSTQDVGKPLKDVEVSYRPLELRSRIEQVQTERRPVSVRDVQWNDGSGNARYFDVSLTPLVHDDGTFVGVTVSFIDVTRYNHLQQQLQSSRSELETAYEELQSTVEELETTNEELQSTNEELETTNEELHSTNEELETMNEELHSTNEELETINDELRSRTDDLNQVNSFLESILANLKSAVIVLDSDMGVLVWSKRTEDLWGLRADEVLGKHLLNLDIGLPIDKLHASIRNCITDRENENNSLEIEAVNRRGRSIRCRIDISALRDLSGEIDGAIVLTDVISESGGDPKES